jgi:HSP20 family molecular chaperone IbpA
MLRQVTKLPLSRVLSPPVLNKVALPSLAAAASVCHFSTRSRARAEESIPVHKKEHKGKNKLSKQKENYPMYSPWDSSMFSMRSFDDFFARDPFFAPVFKDPFFEDFHREMRDFHREMMPVLRSRPQASSLATHLIRASPGYEIKESEDAYEIAVEIPEGLGKDDLEVELERDGTVVRVSGKREVKDDDGSTTMTHFSKRFTIGKGVVDTDKAGANFSDGCLVIRAPKLDPPVEAKRTIQITSKPHQEISDEELRQKTFNDAFDESDWVETGKKQQEQRAA